MKAKKTNNSGITLIALVVTIIVLLILTGIVVATFIGENSVINRAKESKISSATAQIQERISLAYQAAVIDGNGYATEEGLERELKAEFNKDSLENGWLDKRSNIWRITIDGVSLDLSIEGSQNSTADPAVLYQYANNDGVVSATELIQGDIINYYYDSDEEPIECIVLYNDDEHGLQVIPIDSVRDVCLGYDEDEEIGDPFAIEAFSDPNNIPEGYENTEFDIARYSYNHEIATLNNYAQDYLGEMAISARCLGTPIDGIVLSENDTDNMYIPETSSYHYEGYEGIFKDPGEELFYGEMEIDNYSVNEDLYTMDALNVIQCDSCEYYWFACRKLNYWAGNTINNEEVPGTWVIEAGCEFVNYEGAAPNVYALCEVSDNRRKRL